MPGDRRDLVFSLSKAHSLLINLGGLDKTRLALIKAGIKAAQREGKPWVLDPVGAGGSPWRSKWANRCLQNQPTLLKGNAAEIRALAGDSARLAGMDSLDDSQSAQQASKKLSHRSVTVLVTGAKDLVVSPNQQDVLQGGHPLTPQLTATGCALGAVGAACLADLKPHQAGVVAATLFNQAAEMAGPKAQGLGSFTQYFLDALGSTTEAQV